MFVRFSLSSVKSASSTVRTLQKTPLFLQKMSIYTEEHIHNKLVKELDASFVKVVDESDGCGGKFSCVVVSEKFRGKPLLQRHRLVNAALQEELKTIHAFSQTTFAPDEWKEKS